MAQMIPNQLRLDTESRAEQALYNAFKQQLPDEIVVFHHVPWQARDVMRGASDGEADFIIADPKRGILLLEVKGGGIRYEGIERQWYSGPHPIQDPFEQVMRSKYSLLNLLKEQHYWHQRFVHLGHAVAFPDVALTRTRIRSDAPREIVLDSTHMHDLYAWLQSVFAYWNGQEARSEPPGTAGVQQLMNLISPTVELRPLLGAAIAQEEQELLQVTEEQFYLLDLLSRERQLAIMGCAGSGKTLIAVEKARRLCAQGFRVLLTCFNRNLAAFMRASVAKNDQLIIKHFHGLCTELAQEAGLWNKGGGAPTSEFFRTWLPEQLVNAADMLDWHVDAVIVDEGQDFREEWWLALRCLLHDPDQGIFYVFFDDHQMLYGENAIPLKSAPVILSKNCRNTRAIYDYVNTYYVSDHPITSLGPIGRDVEILTYQNDSELQRILRRQIHRLVREERIDAQDIVILTPRSAGRSALSRMGSLGEFALSEVPGESGEIFWTNIYQFKGLESPVVILVEVISNGSDIDLQASDGPDEAQLASANALLTSETLMYVGASRARNHLIVLHKQDG